MRKMKRKLGLFSNHLFFFIYNKVNGLKYAEYSECDPLFQNSHLIVFEKKQRKDTNEIQLLVERKFPSYYLHERSVNTWSSMRKYYY